MEIQGAISAGLTGGGDLYVPTYTPNYVDVALQIAVMTANQATITTRPQINPDSITRYVHTFRFRDPLETMSTE